MTTLPSLIRWLAAPRMPALRRWASQVVARALLAREPDLRRRAAYPTQSFTREPQV